MVIPEEELFVCPISLDLMSDPVTLLGTGHTYDRPTIQRWLAAGHRTCPVTMQPLQQCTLVPNRTLKHLIDRWLLIGNDDVLAAFLSESLAASRSSTTLVETLRIVRSLSPAGFCPLLLQLLLAHAQGSRNDDEESEAQSVLVAELALDCLVGSPSTHELASALHEALQEEEGSSNMSSLVLLLRQGSAKVKTGLCRVMEMVAAAAAAEEKEKLMRMPQLGQTEQVMGVLAGLVRDKGNAAASEAALRAMSSLCSSDQASRATAVAAGAVDALVSYISGSAAKTRETRGRLALALALRTLELLLGLDAGRQAMYSHPTATAVLVRMVFRAPSDQGGGSEHAIGSLLVACRESARVRVDAINAGLLTQLLLLLQSQCCSTKAKAKARALLRAMWPPNTE